MIREVNRITEATIGAAIDVINPANICGKIKLNQKIGRRRKGFQQDLKKIVTPQGKKEYFSLTHVNDSAYRAGFNTIMKNV